MTWLLSISGSTSPAYNTQKRVCSGIQGMKILTITLYLLSFRQTISSYKNINDCLIPDTFD